MLEKVLGEKYSLHVLNTSGRILFLEFVVSCFVIRTPAIIGEDFNFVSLCVNLCRNKLLVNNSV